MHAFVIYVSCKSLFCHLFCSLWPCSFLLGGGWPLGSLVYGVFLCFCCFPMCSPRSGVVLGCINS